MRFVNILGRLINLTKVESVAIREDNIIVINFINHTLEIKAKDKVEAEKQLDTMWHKVK